MYKFALWTVSKSNFLEKMREKRFVAYETSVEDYVESMENRNMKEKTKRDVQLFEKFLRKEKNDLRGSAHDCASRIEQVSCGI